LLRERGFEPETHAVEQGLGPGLPGVLDDLAGVAYRGSGFAKSMTQKTDVASLDAGEQSSLLSLRESALRQLN
jgi:hypothetical protein